MVSYADDRGICRTDSQFEVIKLSFELDRKAFLLSSAGALASGVIFPPSASQAMPASVAMPLPPAADASADADMRAVLEELLAFNAPPLPTVTPRVARDLPSFADALQAVLSKQNKPCVEAVAAIHHKVINGPGGQLLLRIYTPAGSGPFPVVVYYHGGGWVIANLDTYDASPRGLANAAGSIIVSVAYRQAPEHRFPAAVEDAFAAYRWVVANAASIGGDARRIAVAGESAGGNLATVTCMLARDRGVRMPLHQLLVYPVANFATDTPSYAKYAAAIPLNKPAVMWFGKYYLRSKADAANPLASPLRGNLRGLPPATVINAEIDPLRDDGLNYASRLKAAGVKATRTLYSGVSHEFFGMGAAVKKSAEAMKEAGAALKSALG